MPESLQRVQELTGRSLEFEEMDILDQAALERLFKKVGSLQAGRGHCHGPGPVGQRLTRLCACSTALRQSSTSRDSRLWASQCRSLWTITELT